MQKLILSIVLGFLSLFSCFLLLNCGKADCLDIYDKFTGNGQYYFELEGRRITNSQGNAGRSYPTTIVSQEVYNRYSIGDTYCPD